MSTAEERWADALRVASVLAAAPQALGGAVLHAPPGPLRDAWTQAFRRRLAADAPWLRVPAHVTADRLLGGLDLAATLAAKRPCFEPGLIMRAHRGVLLIPMSERMDAMTTSGVCGALDQREVLVEREGFGERRPADISVIALDEHLPDEAPTSAALRDRLAFWVELDGLPARLAETVPMHDLNPGEEGRLDWTDVRFQGRDLDALAAVALSLGIDSIRSTQLALRTARVHAALEGRPQLCDEDLSFAARFVLAPRAERLPAAEPEPSASEPSDSPERRGEPEGGDPSSSPTAGAQQDILVQAAISALPRGLLERLTSSTRADRTVPGRSGAAGRARAHPRRGRPRGSRPGDPARGRLHVLETVRAAVPWQRARSPEPGHRLQVRREDFRLRRYEERSSTLTLFVVDASGSSAYQRLAEAKGAVERVLADCYVRRDEVALIAFRGRSAELLLAPTRSLVRAKRCLAELPGGGSTPLAAGIDAALLLARQVQRRGDTPVLIFMTDGRANVARDGTKDRARAESDAQHAARELAAAGLRALFVDTSPRARPEARQLAALMGAEYLLMPHVDPGVLESRLLGSPP